MQVLTFNSGLLDENMYALIYKDFIAIVDPGNYTAELGNFVKNNKDNIKFILLTHRHIDHLYGLYPLMREVPKAQVVIHKSDALGTSDKNISMASLFGLEQKPIFPNILVSDNYELDFADKKIKVMHTPGHTIGSVCYIIDDIIFSGDTIFNLSIGRTDFESGSMASMQKSLKRLKELKGNYHIYSGHGEVTTLDFERNYNSYLFNL